MRAERIKVSYFNPDRELPDITYTERDYKILQARSHYNEIRLYCCTVVV